MKKGSAYVSNLFLVCIFLLSMTGCSIIKPAIRDNQSQSKAEDKGETGGEGGAACEEVCYEIRTRHAVGCMGTTYNDVMEINLDNCSGEWQGDIGLKIGLGGPKPFTFADTYPDTMLSESEAGLDLLPIVPEEPKGENSFGMDFSWQRGMEENVSIDEASVVLTTTVHLDVEIDIKNGKAYFTNVDVNKGYVLYGKFNPIEDLFPDHFEEKIRTRCK